MKPSIKAALEKAGVTSDEDLLRTEDARLHDICKIDCFDLRALARRLRASNRTIQLLEAHLALDHILTAFFEQELQRPESLNVERWEFFRKLELFYALGAVPMHLFTVARDVNALRNKVAHRFGIKISQSDIQNLFRDFPPEFASKTRPAERFRKGLGLTVILLEQARQKHLASEVIHIKYEKTCAQL